MTDATASGRSPAATPSPRSAARASPARPCTYDRDLRGRQRIDPARQQRADDAAQHVAAARGGERRTGDRADERTSVGRRDHRARPLEHDDRARRRGETPRDTEAIRLDRRRRDAGEAAHLRRVRRQHPRRRRRRQHGGRVGAERVERVGVEDHRPRRDRREPANGRLHPRARRDPRPDRDRLGARRQRRQGGDGLVGVDRGAARVARRHQLDHLGVQRRLPGRRRRHRHQAGARAQRGLPDEHRRPGPSRRARHDQQVSRASLVGRGPPARQPRRDPRFVQQEGARGAIARRPGRRRNAEPDDLDASDRRVRVQVQTQLGRGHRRGHVGAEHDAFAAPAVGVQTRGHVDGDPARAGGVHGGQRSGRRAVDRAAKTGAEDRVDDDARVSEPFAPRRLRRPAGAVRDRHARHPLQRGQHDRGIAVNLRHRRGERDPDGDARAREVARDHEPVAAVVARAADDRDGPGAGTAVELAPDDLGDAAPGVLHQQHAGDRQRVDRRRVGGAHLGRRQQRCPVTHALPPRRSRPAAR